MEAAPPPAPVFHLPTISCGIEKYQRAGAGLPANHRQQAPTAGTDPGQSQRNPVTTVTQGQLQWETGKTPKLVLTDVRVKGRWKDITQQVKSQDKTAFSL